MSSRHYEHRRWVGTESVFVSDLSAGDVVGWDYQPWRVIEVTPRPADLVDERGRDTVLVVEPLTGGKQTHLSCRRWAWMYRFPSPQHIPVCIACGDLMPCREQVIDQTVEAEAERLARYELAGVCPACQEPVSQRQLRQTWPENLYAPTGQPVTFHLRKRCEREAAAYDQAWRRAGHPSQLGVVE